MKSYNVTIQMKAIEQHFSVRVVPIILPCGAVFLAIVFYRIIYLMFF